MTNRQHGQFARRQPPAGLRPGKGAMNTELLQQQPGPSTYVNAEYYQRLYEIARDWSNPGQTVPLELFHEISALLNRECRLLDDGRFEEWLDLFQEQCIYWVPSDVLPRDPGRTISWEIQDRRRLEDKIARFRTGFAFSQLPPTRSRHCLSNIEIWAVGETELRVRANLTIHTYRKGKHETLACMGGYVLQRQADQSWLIELKQINLIDADQAQGNISFML